MIRGSEESKQSNASNFSKTRVRIVPAARAWWKLQMRLSIWDRALKRDHLPVPREAVEFGA